MEAVENLGANLVDDCVSEAPRKLLLPLTARTWVMSQSEDAPAVAQFFIAVSVAMASQDGNYGCSFLSHE